MILTGIQGYRHLRNACASYFTKFCMDVDWIVHAVEILWTYETHTHLILSNLYAREIPSLRGFCIWKRKKNWGKTLNISKMLSIPELYSLIPVWMTLTLVGRLQFCEDAKASVAFFLHTLNQFWMENLAWCHNLSVSCRKESYMHAYTSFLLHKSWNFCDCTCAGLAPPPKPGKGFARADHVC